MILILLLGILLSLVELNIAVKPQEVMLRVANEFAMAGLMCKSELGFSDDMIEKFLHFWHEDYEGTPNEMGCAIYCLIRKLDLVDAQGNLQDFQITAFMMSNGAVPSMISRLMEVVTRECPTKPAAETNVPGVPGHCLKAMTMADCLRKGVLDMNVGPIGGEQFPGGMSYF